MKPLPILVLSLCPLLQAADLTGDEIVRSAVEVGKRQAELRQQYIYREHQEDRVLNADGSAGKLYINRDFEDIFLEGAFYRKLVASDGKPLKPKDAKAEDARMRMTAAERRAAPPPKNQGRTLQGGIPFEDAYKVMEHKILREEEMGGRMCWVVQSVPRGDAAPKTDVETRAMAYRFTSWIDQIDRAIVREEWEVIGAGQDTKPGSTVAMVFVENADGVWLRQSAEMRAISGSGNPPRFLQTNVYSDYRRFASETNVRFEDAP